MPDTFRLHCHRCGEAFLLVGSLLDHRRKCDSLRSVPTSAERSPEPPVPLPAGGSSPNGEPTS